MLSRSPKLKRKDKECAIDKNDAHGVVVVYCITNVAIEQGLLKKFWSMVIGSGLDI